MDKNKETNTSASINIDSTNIDKNKDISNSFGNVAVGRVGRNIRKQLKINKFKLFVAIIIHKKFYLPKKIALQNFWSLFLQSSIFFVFKKLQF